MCLGLEMGQSCQVPLDSGSEHSGMSLPPLKGMKLASSPPSTPSLGLLPGACQSKSHQRKARSWQMFL